MSFKFRHLLAKYAVGSYLRQTAFLDYLRWQLNEVGTPQSKNPPDFSLNLAKRMVTFGGSLTYPIQVLGTEAYDDHSWLWIWANPIRADMPPVACNFAQHLKRYGKDQQIEEFTSERFSIDAASGTQLALVAAGMSQSSTFFTQPFEGGAVFFLVDNLPDSCFQPATSPQISRAIANIASTFDVDTRRLVERYFEQVDFRLTTEGRWLIAKARDGREIAIEFNDVGELAHIKVHQ